MPTKAYVILTDLGIEKNKEFQSDRKTIEKVKAAVKDACKGLPANGPLGNTCCG